MNANLLLLSILLNSLATLINTFLTNGYRIFVGKQGALDSSE